MLCILGIVYVHAWTGLPGGDLARLNDTPQGILRWALIDLLGRGAVPLLSVISGWLVAASLARRGWRSFLPAKARTIILPMILWNAFAIVLVSGAARLGWIQAPMPTTLWWTIDELLCLASPNDINVQMSFLRDLFVCMLLAPLLMRLPNWALGIAALVALAWSVSGVAFVLLLRPAILLFFIAGILARRRDLAAWVAMQPMAVTGVAYALLAALQIWLETAGIARGVDNPLLLSSIDLAMRCVTALFFWSIAWRLAGSRFTGALLGLEPFAFLMFSAHLIMIWLGGPLIGRLTGPLGAPLYPVFLLVQPLLVLAATLLLGRLLAATSPALATVLSGGRLKPAAEVDRPADLRPHTR
ncbi:acyltransferase [Sphingosinicella sp. LHD-64]|nr:acyltransferase [Sphingosinicella sp. LHD-64]MDQ8756282.1 acyltransferase [Sphingosinicella sp. LHD-64]